MTDVEDSFGVLVVGNGVLAINVTEILLLEALEVAGEIPMLNKQGLANVFEVDLDPAYVQTYVFEGRASELLRRIVSVEKRCTALVTQLAAFVHST